MPPPAVAPLSNNRSAQLRSHASILTQERPENSKSQLKIELGNLQIEKTMCPQVKLEQNSTAT